jgi:hypothetical protein
MGKGIGKTGYSHAKKKKKKLDLCFISDTNNSKWIKDLNLYPEIIELLEENTGRKLNTGLGSDFLDLT